MRGKDFSRRFLWIRNNWVIDIMRRHSISGIAFRMQMNDAIGWSPVLTVHQNHIVCPLLRVGVLAIGVSVLLLAASPAWAISFVPNVFTILQTADTNAS